MMGNISESTFNQLFEQYHEWIYYQAIMMFKNHHDAEDMVQEIFLKVWQRHHQWDSTKGTFTAWLNTVARRTMLDAKRRNSGLKKERLARWLNELPTSSPFTTLSELVTRDEWRRCLDVIPQIPNPKHRLAFILRHVEGYSISETARILNCPSGSAKIWAYRGRAALREILKEDAETEE